MKIIVVGGAGTIGKAIVQELSSRHEIIVAGRSAAVKCDMESEESIRNMYKQVGKFDAIIVTAGNVAFDDFAHMTAEKFQIGLNSKLMGQINIVRIGCEFIQDKGSFTLTSGILSHDPVRMGCGASVVNGAIDSFVCGAAIELPRGIRINAVSPTIITESLNEFGSFFRGYSSVSASKVALGYAKSVEGLQTGRVFKIEN